MTPGAGDEGAAPSCLESRSREQPRAGQDKSEGTASPFSPAVLTQVGFLHLAHFQHALRHACPAVRELHDPVHGGADDLLAALLLHPEELPHVRHPVRSGLLADSLWGILLAHASNRSVDSSFE